MLCFSCVISSGLLTYFIQKLKNIRHLLAKMFPRKLLWSLRSFQCCQWKSFFARIKMVVEGQYSFEHFLPGPCLLFYFFWCEHEGLALTAWCWWVTLGEQCRGTHHVEIDIDSHVMLIISRLKEDTLSHLCYWQQQCFDLSLVSVTHTEYINEPQNVWGIKTFTWQT